MADLFYGPYKIIDEKRDDVTKTIILTFAPQPESQIQKLTERITEKIYHAAVQPTPTDLTTLRELRIRPIVKEMMGILIGWNVKIGEIEFLMNKLTGSVNEAQNIALDLLWGQPDYERSMFELDQIIRQKADKIPHAEQTGANPSADTGQKP